MAIDDGQQGERYGAMFRGATILFLHAPKADPYLTHRTSIATYAAAYRRQGIEAVVLDLSVPDFMTRFAEITSRPDVIAVHCEQSWGLDLAIEQAGKAVDVFEYFNKPAIAHIRDYPFYPWLRGRTLVPRGNRILCFTERSAVDFAGPFQGSGVRSQIHFAPHIYLDSEDHAAPVPWRARPIDLLYVGSYADPMAERAKFATARPELAPLLDAIIDQALPDYHTPFWVTAAKVTKAQGLAPDHGSAIYLDLLVAANQFIRNERRRRMLLGLASIPMHLIWSGPKPDISLHPDTVVMSANTLPDTLALCGQAKAMAMCLNNFATSLSERLLSAMQRGAAVLCAANAMIDGVFEDGKDIITLGADYRDVGERFAALRDPHKGEALTSAARAKVEAEYSPDARIAQFLAALTQFYGVNP